MLKGFLTVEPNGPRVPVGARAVVGRTRDCTVMIEDAAASRKHLEVNAKGDKFHWKDLGSTNGTVLNGASMLAGELKDGDVFQIGETRLRFNQEEHADEPEMGTTSLFQETILGPEGLVAPETAPPARSMALLEAVYKVMNDIAANYDPCGLIDRILETTMRAINGQRGALFLADNDETLAPCPVCGHVHRIRDGVVSPAEPGEIRISGTVARRVLGGGESVLYQDTDSDSELNASESILSLKLRSILCVPLRAKDRILGILYVDTNREDQAYTRDDMLLAAAVGNSAGLALDNARMHREILEKQRIEQEIATAWTIQEGFLVKEWPEDDSRFEVYGETRPAKTVGGDFYDFVHLSPDVVGILIGDVSGKGVPAALNMAQLLASFRLHARDHASPAEVLRLLNEDLVERSQYGMFCTLCYVRLSLTDGEVVCANAGHLPAMRLAAHGATLEGSASGVPAGILADGTWEDARFRLAPGETLLLCTDGILEAQSSQTRHERSEPAAQYEFDGVTECAAACGGVPPKTLIEKINEDVLRFCAPLPPHDDCTMIAVRYCGQSE